MPDAALVAAADAACAPAAQWDASAGAGSWRRFAAHIARSRRAR
eukprot:gene55689-30295_t